MLKTFPSISNARCTNNMNDYGIPIIEPTVDFTKVPPIHQKRTITFVNHFIIQTVTFLNKFALCCEERLFEFENKLQRVEASLEILESRLSSIPDVDSPAESKSPIKTVSDDQAEREDDTKPDIPDVAITTQAEPSEGIIANSGTQPISKDPRYAKYFKMVQFGVPAQAVKLKMKQEGLDPFMLDNPDQMVPTAEVAERNTNTDEEDG